MYGLSRLSLVNVTMPLQLLRMISRSLERRRCRARVLPLMSKAFIEDRRIRSRTQLRTCPWCTSRPPTAPWLPSFTCEFGATPPLLAIKLSETPVHDQAEIEAAVTAFASEPAGGLIVAPDPFP